MKVTCSPFRVSQRGVKPAPNSAAQSSGLCDLENKNFIAGMRKNIEEFLKNSNDKILVFMLGLMYCYGLRVSEVLALDRSSMLGNYQLLVRGSKGSESRIVTVFYAKEVYDSLLLNTYPLGYVYSRFWLYRELKKYGLYGYFGTNMYASVTHLARHLKVLTLTEQDVPRGTISHFLGHKSIKSLSYYEKKGKSAKRG